MGSYVFSAFQSQFPAWTLGALDIAMASCPLESSPSHPGAAREGSSWTTAPSQVTAMVNLVPFNELHAVAGLSTPSRSSMTLLIRCSEENRVEGIVRP